MVRSEEKESGGHHARVQGWGEGLKTTPFWWTMDRAHPGVVHSHLLFHNTYRLIPAEIKFVLSKEVIDLDRKIHMLLL